jgi:hypothetical protein
MSDSNPELNKEEVKPEYNETTAVLKKDLLIGLLRTEGGPAILANIHGREEMIMAKGELDAFLSMKLMQGDMRADMARNKIVPAPSGIMGFARKRFK